MKPRYKLLLVDRVVQPDGHPHGNSLWFESAVHSDCIWFLGRRRWLYLRRLTESQ